MIETVPGLKAIPVLLNGGINEIAASDSLLPEDAVKMLNWRLSKDGTRIQKRAGLQEEGLVAAVDDVYGYSTYVDSSANFCQLAVLEGQLMRKVGAGAWTQIYDWPAAATIDHVVKPLEIQGKQFIITEKGSRVILPDSTIRQIGISPPTTLPTVTATDISGISPPVLDYMNYADQPAMDAAWTDGDFGTGISTLENADPDAVPGPDADAKYMRLLSTVGTANKAFRSRTHAGYVGGDYVIDLAIYMNVATTVGNTTIRSFRLIYDDGFNIIHLGLGTDGLYVFQSWGPGIKIVTGVIPQNKWLTIKARVVRTPGSVVVSITVTIEWDGITQLQGTSKSSNALSTTEGYCMLAAYQLGDFYIDHLRILTQEDVTASALTGRYKYAISFIRGGNYGCESNAFKSIVGIGGVTFSGLSQNDMTIKPTSVYTGDKTRTFIVKVFIAISTPDTIRWSDDGGSTWKNQVLAQTEMYLSHGITILFAATDGHTINDQWTFTCLIPTVIVSFQAITLTNIPVSTDTQVTGRKIYRTDSGGVNYYYLTTINDNTTTSYIDSYPDMTLGELLEEDRDLFTQATIGPYGSVSTTIGKFSEWWDNRLWIADHIQNIIFYSAIRSGGGVPEEFSITDRFVTIRKGDQGDVITAMIAFKDALYVFKRNDIFIIQKTAYGYGVYHLNSDVGCVADGCVIVANDLIMFPSERGVELYDGVKPYTPEFSLAVNKTFLSADPTGYKYMSMVHDKEYNEVWLSIPSRVSSGTPTTTVWNYIKNKFYLFQFYKIPSCLVSCKDSTGKRVVKMGTRDGYVLLCDYGTADNATAITATYRKGWMDMEAHGIARLLKVKYELPAAKTITANIYVDMDKDVFRTAALTGVTPAATDIDLRRIIGDKAELGTRNRWLSVEFTNAEDCGGECKINAAFLFVRPNVIKNKTYAD